MSFAYATPKIIARDDVNFRYLVSDIDEHVPLLARPGEGLNVVDLPCALARKHHDGNEIIHLNVPLRIHSLAG